MTLIATILAWIFGIFMIVVLSSITIALILVVIDMIREWRG